MESFRRARARVSELLGDRRSRMALLFGVEGLLLQFQMSLGASNGFGTNIYATNLGATDSEIGMIQLVANLFAVVLLLPVGMISDRTKNAKTMPATIMAIVGAMFFFYGSVPLLSSRRMTYFFVSLCGTAGLLSIYNSIWQAFFGDVTPIEQRNRVYAFRNQFIFIIATAAPVLCGALLGMCGDTAGKLRVMQWLYYLCGALALLNAWVIARMPGGRRSPEALARLPKVSPKAIAQVLGGLFRDRRFLSYFGSIMFFYIGWHIDWSVWYIGQVQYVGMSEVELSVYSALVSIAQLAGVGVFVRLVERHGVQKTFLLPLLSIALCPVLMYCSLIVPNGAGPAVMIAMATVILLPQCATNLCLVQMLLDAIPQENRSLIVSLNMVFVTLSNALIPFLGVQLYRLLGGDRRAFVLFEALMLLLRGSVLVVFALRAWRQGRRERNISLDAGNESA